MVHLHRMISARICVNTGPRMRENAINISANVPQGLLAEAANVSVT